MGISHGLLMGLRSTADRIFDTRRQNEERDYARQQREQERQDRLEQQAFIREMERAQSERLAEEARRSEFRHRMDMSDRGFSDSLTPQAESQIRSYETAAQGVNPITGGIAQLQGVLQRRDLGAGQLTKIGPSVREREALANRQMRERENAMDIGLRREQNQMRSDEMAADREYQRGRDAVRDRQWGADHALSRDRAFPESRRETEEQYIARRVPEIRKLATDQLGNSITPEQAVSEALREYRTMGTKGPAANDEEIQAAIRAVGQNQTEIAKWLKARGLSW